MKRSGVADLPLHGGRVPQWLADRMSKLGTAIAESIIQRYGRSEADFKATMEHEKNISPGLGGRSDFD